jgi:hypothetical protein
VILDKLKAYGFQALALALGVLLLVQTGRLQVERVAHQKLIAATAGAALQLSEAARADETKTAGKEAAHAQATQENSDAFTTSQPVRDALHRADLATADRLRVGAERRAATYLAQAQSNAAACRNLADRHAALDAHVVRGAGVVAGLGADLERRDAEVALLRAQIDVERALVESGAPRR